MFHWPFGLLLCSPICKQIFPKENRTKQRDRVDAPQCTSLLHSPLWSPWPPPMALSATELLPVTTVEASGSLAVSMLPPPFPESSSLSWSFIMCLAVMASTLERFRFRLPSELGWAPGWKRLEEVTDEEPASEADPCACADDGALAEAARMMDVEASLGGLGVP